MLTNEYLKRVYEGLEKRNANEPEFLQAVREVLESIQPVVEKHPEYSFSRMATSFLSQTARILMPNSLNTSINSGNRRDLSISVPRERI